MEKLHVINNRGFKKEVTWAEMIKLNEVSNCDEDKFYHDIDWYLSNGYHLIDDVIKDFEERLKADNNI